MLEHICGDVGFDVWGNESGDTGTFGWGWGGGVRSKTWKVQKLADV